MLGSHQSNISSLIIMYHQSIYPIYYYSLGHSQVLNYNSISVPVLKHCPPSPLTWQPVCWESPAGRQSRPPPWPPSPSSPSSAGRWRTRWGWRWSGRSRTGWTARGWAWSWPRLSWGQSGTGSQYRSSYSQRSYLLLVLLVLSTQLQLRNQNILPLSLTKFSITACICMNFASVCCYKRVANRFSAQARGR